jgi:WD40 repeat protein
MKTKLLLFTLGFSLAVYGQETRFNFQLTNSVPVTVNGKTLRYPWAGGLNNPQFCDIDFNSDGLEDLLVFDRDGQKILPFLNHGTPGQPNYIYRADYEKHFPAGITFYATVDYNNDGKKDIFTRDIDRNLRVYKNVSNDAIPDFEDMGPMLRETVTEPPLNWQLFKMEPTDIPAFVDLDHDGDIDVVFYQSFYQGYAMCRNYQVDSGLPADEFRFRFEDFCFGYFRESPFFNEVFLGKCNEPFKWRHPGGSSCLLWDMDNDSDYEMVIGNVGYENLIFLKNGKNDFRTYWDTMIDQDGVFPRNTRQAANYEFPAAFKTDIDKDGISDLVVSPSAPGTSSEYKQVWYYKNTGTENNPVFDFRQDNLLQEEMIDLGGNSAPFFWDIDSDGDMDLLMIHNGNYSETSNWRDRIALFRNTGTPTAPAFTLEDEDFLRFSTQGLSYMRICMGDLNGDGKADLLVGNMGGFVRYYMNNSVGSSIAFVLADTNLLKTPFNLRDRYYAAPELWDYNEDGKLDLLVGGYDGRIELWENTGTSTSPAFTLIDTDFGKMRANEFRWDFNPPSYASDGMATPRLCDLDGDGKKELLVGTIYGQIHLYNLDLTQMPDSFPLLRNVFHAPGDNDGPDYDLGYLSTAAAADLDGDGKQEIVAGNSRGGLMFFTNNSGSITSVKAQNVAARQLMMKPNPANNEVLVYAGAYGKGSLQIMDMSGRIVKVIPQADGKRITPVDVSNLNDGIYVVVFSGQDYQASGRLVIRR